MRDQAGFSLLDGMDLSGIKLDELWWRYAAMGGQSGPALLAERMTGLAPCDQYEHNLIAQALNESFVDRGMETFPVAYVEPAPLPHSADARIIGTAVRPTEARSRAIAARKRSSLAARRAVSLHMTSAQLMHASGQLQFAEQMRERAGMARARSIPSTGANVA